MKAHGGSTTFKPAAGLWTEEKGRPPVEDELISFYIMTKDIPAVKEDYLPKLKSYLENQFEQDQVMIIYYPVTEV